MLEVAVLLHEINVAIDHIPHLLDAEGIETAIAQHLGTPAALWWREELQCVAEMRCGELGTLHIAAVAFVDDDAVGHLHDTAFDALQFVAGTGQLDEHEEIHHRVTRRLALTYTYGFHEYLVVAGSLTQDDGLARFACHTAQAACRGTGAYEGIGMHGQFLHARLVAEDTALGLLAGGVNGQHGKFAAVFA